MAVAIFTQMTEDVKTEVKHKKGNMKEDKKTKTIVKDIYETIPDLDPEFQKYLQKIAKRKHLRQISKEFGKKFIKGLFLTGVLCIAATSPYFLTNLVRSLIRYGFRELEKSERKRFSDMFSEYQRMGWITVDKEEKQIYISLTKEGKKRAREYQINDLAINTPKVWDRKWRVLIFDIPEKNRIKREALRGKLKELDFTKLQKSVWIHPYPCENELVILKAFFGFRENNYLFFETDNLGQEEARLLRKYNLVRSG